MCRKRAGSGIVWWTFLLSLAAALTLAGPGLVGEALAGGNPCAAKNPCAANPCAAKNPCAANPCAAKNPCAANPCAANPCAAKNPCAANPCAAKNPCAANPCAPGAAGGPQARARMVIAQVVSYDQGAGRLTLSHNGQSIVASVTPKTVVRRGPKVASPQVIRKGERAVVSLLERGRARQALYIYLAQAAPAANPCAANPCAAKNPCAANPCAAKNPCAANPCATKNPCATNPCAANPCAAKKNPCAANPCAANPCAANPCAGR